MRIILSDKQFSTPLLLILHGRPTMVNTNGWNAPSNTRGIVHITCL